MPHPSPFLRQQIAQAQAQLANVPTSEHWFLDRTNWQIPISEINPELIQKFFLPQSPTLVLVNGHFAPQLSAHLEQIQWQLVDPYDDAHYLHESTLVPFTTPFPSSTPLGLNLFERFNLAWPNVGLIIHIPQYTQWARPLVLLHLYTKEIHHRHYQPRICIKAEDHAQGTVLEIHHYVGRLDPADFSANAVTYFELQSQSKISHLLWQNLHSKAYFHQQIWAQQAKDSELQALVVNNGASHAIIDGQYQLQAPGAQAILNGIYHTIGDQKADLSFHVEHQAPATTSGQLIKGILHDGSRANFTGNIHIAPGAQKASAGQMAKALLVSPLAQVATQPNLLVEADDVKCSHGMAVAQLNPEELFYLNTRGIAQPAAVALLEEAFCQECLLPFVPLSYRQLLAAEIISKRGTTW